MVAKGALCHTALKGLYHNLKLHALGAQKAELTANQDSG